MKNGLSQEDRHKRINSAKPFTVLDDDPASLLKRAETLAACIRLFDLSGKHDGYFDQVLRLLDELNDNNNETTPDGNMEPSKSLLITFIRQLCNITGRFNKKWEKYINWYVNHIMKVTSQSACPDSTWISLTKNSPTDIFVRKGTNFTFDGAEMEDKVLFQSAIPTRITNATVEKAYSLHFDKNATIYPAYLFNIPTALRIKDLLCERKTGEMLFDERVNPQYSHPIGLCIASPTLLLREGKRFITIEFEAEQVKEKYRQQRRNMIKLLKQLMEDMAPISRKDAKEVLLIKIVNDIFYLEISTANGWKPIEKYAIQGKINPEYSHIRKLILKFELQDDFPATYPCNTATHQFEADHPGIKILLNRDSCLYPYSWLKDFMIAKINLTVDVEGVNQVLFYNELGKIDNSIPFAPFGNNTEQSAWFVIGNYEMSMKYIESANVHIRWQQLPTDNGGLYTYYQEYDRKIDNRSFKIKTRFLSDYKWNDTDNQEPMYLFSSVVKDKQGNPSPQHKLSDESSLKGIRFENMKPVYLPEEKYDYSIRSKSGFFNFVLTDPEIGFGEKTYRRLFSERLIKKALRKKKKDTLNPPITPQIERITLSYRATEKVDLRIFRKERQTTVAHVYPFGIRQIYPTAENNPEPFVFSLDTDANILFGLKEVSGNEPVNLFIDFFPQKGEIQTSELPRVRWYWGDGYRWSILPDDAVRKDTTRNLLTSGLISIYIPEIPDEGFRDKDGILWLRAGITENEKSISEINKIHTNAINVFRNSGQMDKKLPDGFILNTAEAGLPGIASVEQLTPISTGVPAENDTTKLIRVSEFISHRNRAVTARDYERMTLQAFPQVGKVKCLKNINTKKNKCSSSGTVSLVIFPSKEGKGIRFRPYSQPEVLLDIESYFSTKTSSFVKNIDAINPVYEEIMIRCTVDFHLTEQSKAFLRAVVRTVINHTIAPWQHEGKLPDFNHSFGIRQLLDKINTLAFVKNVEHLSVVQLIQDQENDKYTIREYSQTDEVIRPSAPHAIPVPSANHIIKSDINEAFGIDEMTINENFVIW